MEYLTTEEAAAKLGVSARRVQQLIKNRRLPAKEFGGSYMIDESDLKLVEDRKPGRPPKAKGETSKAAKKGREK